MTRLVCLWVLGHLFLNIRSDGVNNHQHILYLFCKSFWIKASVSWLLTHCLENMCTLYYSGKTSKTLCSWFCFLQVILKINSIKIVVWMWQWPESKSSLYVTPSVFLLCANLFLFPGFGATVTCSNTSPVWSQQESFTLFQTCKILSGFFLQRI